LFRYRLTLAYDGTDFAGWQRQGAGERTVQGVLEGALTRLGGGVHVAVDGAGRTDAGVHALGQVASCSLEQAWEPADLQRALNAVLPPDLRVRALAAAAPRFHARRSACAKQYRYEMDVGAWQLPCRRRIAGLHVGRCDEELARQAAALYLGRRDFSALASSGSGVRSTVREVTRSEVRFGPTQAGAGPTLVYETRGDGFLRKMVRSMVGGIMAAASGERSVDSLEDALAAGDRRGWPAPAPARGLTLVCVEYGPPGTLS